MNKLIEQKKIEAMSKEIKALKKNDIWEVVKALPNKKLISAR